MFKTPFATAPTINEICLDIMTIQRLYRIIFISLLSLIFIQAKAQKTAANEDKIKLYNTALELYDKQLYNAAISNFMDYLPYATDNINTSDVEFYIASCKLKLLHNNALANMLDFIARYPQSRKINAANLELGDYYFKLGKFKSALSYYKTVQESNLSGEDKERYAYRLGYCYIKSNKTKEAKEILYPLTNTDNPYRTEATYYYGYACYMDKDYTKALAAFKQVQDQNIGAVKLYIAEIYYLQNEYQKAIDFAGSKDFAELNTNRDMLLGKCHYRLGNYEKAQTYFESSRYKINELTNAEAYEIGYTYFSNKNCIKSSELFERIANSGDAMAQSASYHLGDCFLKIGKKQNAFNAFYEAQRTEFDKSIQEEAMFAYAKLAQELEFNNKAIAAYQRFNETFPKSKYKNEGSKNLATLLYTSNDYKAAIAVLEDMNISDESTKDLYQKILFLRSEELYLQKDISSAEGMFKRCIALNSSSEISGESNYWLGEIEYNRFKYDNARSFYQKFMDIAETKKTKYYPEALYGIAYTYYKQQKFAEAANYFLSYKQSVGYTLPESMFHDATLRLGDCYFAISNYNAALDAYTYIISNRKPGADYALFQRGMSYGLQGKQTSKIVVLKKITSSYPNSLFIPEAVFQTAEVYLSLENDVEAERNYNYLIGDYPNSPLVKECHVRLASIYYARNDYGKAMETYKYIARTYPGTPEASKAIKNAEVVAKKQSNIKEYLDWVKTLPNVNISTSKEDSLYYDAAYRKFTSNKYKEATADFKEYLNNFGNGFFTLQAHYYSGLSYLNLKDTSNTLEHLEFVANYQNSEYKEDAILQVCNIYSKRQDCEKGLPFYEQLEKYSSNTLSSRKALYGQLICHNKTKSYEKAKIKAEQILKYDQITNSEKGEANNAIGRYYLNDSMYKVASAYFAKTLKSQQDVYAAEAKYYEAYIRYSQDSLDKCKKSIMEFNNQFNNYDFWLGKTFILLSDYYLKKGDEFQAKATLNSVMEQFDNPEIVATAKEKLAALEARNKPLAPVEGE